MRRLVKCLFGVVLGMCVAGSVDAGIQLSIERISDTQARLTGSGTFDINPADYYSYGGVYFLRLLDDAVIGTSSDRTEHSLSDNTFMVGDAELFGAQTRGSGTIGSAFSLEVDRDLVQFAEVSGSVVVDLIGLTWAAMGSSGTLQWGNGDGSLSGTPEVAVGTWEINSAAAVPEPSTFVLWTLAGAFGILAARRRGEDVIAL